MITVDNLLQELGQRLRQQRIKRDFTQQDLAERVNVSRQVIAKAEKGNASLETLARIMRVLGIEKNILSLIPEEPISPILLSKNLGKTPQRASGKRLPSETGQSEW